VSLPQSVVAGSERVRISVVGKYNQYYNTIKPAHVVTSITVPGSFKLTDISYRLRFSFVSFACSVRCFFVFRSFAFRSCNWFIRLVYRSFHFSFVSYRSCEAFVRFVCVFRSIAFGVYCKLIRSRICIINCFKGKHI
jgi:hypothetical protein